MKHGTLYEVDALGSGYSCRGRDRHVAKVYDDACAIDGYLRDGRAKGSTAGACAVDCDRLIDDDPGVVGGIAAIDRAECGSFAQGNWERSTWHDKAANVGIATGVGDVCHIALRIGWPNAQAHH